MLQTGLIVYITSECVHCNISIQKYANEFLFCSPTTRNCCCF